jgi:hypothetical protein
VGNLRHTLPLWPIAFWLLAIGGLLLISFVPFLQDRFHFVAFHLEDWVKILVLSAIALLWLEIAKVLFYKIQRWHVALVQH